MKTNVFIPMLILLLAMMFMLFSSFGTKDKNKNPQPAPSKPTEQLQPCQSYRGLLRICLTPDNRLFELNLLYLCCFLTPYFH